MSKAIFKFSLGLVLLLGLIACKKNNYTVDVSPLIPPEVARFVQNPAITTAPISYYITESPAPGSAFETAVGVTTVSNVDRKVRIVYSSRTAVLGTHYTAPAEVVIPAGQAKAPLIIQGFFDAYPVGRKDTVIAKIVSGDGFVVPAVIQDSFLLTLQKYCEVDFPTFEGDYENTLEFTASGGVGYGPYDTWVSNVVSTGATTGTAVLHNVYDYGGQVTATFDWTDKGNFTVTIPEQNTGALVSSGGVIYALWLRTNATKPSTFSSCENTITINIDALAKNPTTGVLAGAFSQDYLIRLGR